MQEYKFKIRIEGLNGYLYYSAKAENEQQAVDELDAYLEKAPKIIETDLWDNL